MIEKLERKSDNTEKAVFVDCEKVIDKLNEIIDYLNISKSATEILMEARKPKCNCKSEADSLVTDPDEIRRIIEKAEKKSPNFGNLDHLSEIRPGNTGLGGKALGKQPKCNCKAEFVKELDRLKADLILSMGELKEIEKVCKVDYKKLWEVYCKIIKISWYKINKLIEEYDK